MNIEPEDDFEKRIFRKSKSIMSLRFYRAGKRKFEQFAQYEYKAKLEDIVEQIKSGTLDVYKVLDKYSEWLGAQDFKPKTVIDYVVGAKKLLRFKDVVIINEIFHEKVTLPTKEDIMDEAPSADQIRQIVSRCNPRMKALVLLMATSGMREGEALMLRVKNIDFSSKPARILVSASTTKTSRSRETYISDEAVLAIEQWLDYRRAKSGSIIPTSTLFDLSENIYAAEKDVIQSFRSVMEHFPEMNQLSRLGSPGPQNSPVFPSQVLLFQGNANHRRRTRSCPYGSRLLHEDVQ